MRISRVDVMLVDPDFPEEADCRPVFCRIHTDAGLYGDGEAAMLLMTGAYASYGMLRELARMVIGMDPLDHEVVWNRLYRRTYFAQNGGPTMYSAISAIDMALWDIRGKYFGVPVWKLLGGKQRESVRCYASQIQSGWGRNRRRANTPEEFRRNARLAAAEGYQIVKVDCLATDGEGRPLTEEQRTGCLSGQLLGLVEERVAAVREGIGPDRQIILEGHGFTDAETALQVAERVKKYGILFFEEPCTPFLPAMERFARHSPIPASGGERLYSRWQYLPYASSGVYRLLQPDAGDCGGITELKKIIDLADIFELPVQVHCCASPLCVAATLQVEAVISRFTFHEHTSFQCQDAIRRLCRYDYQPEGGDLRIPDLPGLGNELSDFALTHCEKTVISERGT